MLIRLGFLKLETDHFFVCFFFFFFFFWGGGGGRGADFFQQLKLDIFRDFSESIYLLTIKSHFYTC